MKSTRAAGYAALLSRLRAARKAAGLTQAELAKRLRKPQSFISKYENGEQPLDVVEFVEVTRALGLDACEALTALSSSAAPRASAKR